MCGLYDLRSLIKNPPLKSPVAYLSWQIPLKISKEDIFWEAFRKTIRIHFPCSDWTMENGGHSIYLVGKGRKQRLIVLPQDILSIRSVGLGVFYKHRRRKFPFDLVVEYGDFM